MDSGQLTDKPVEVKEGYHHYFQQLYNLPDEHIPLHDVKVVQVDKCWEGFIDPISEDKLVGICMPYEAQDSTCL